MEIEAQGASAAELPESVPGPSANNDSGSANEGESLAVERSGSDVKRRSRATGPRTEPGKHRSSSNATKHGVYSKVIVLKGESESEYNDLLSGFREDYQPVGALEGLLVERLATTAWRQRRLLLAEGAEIQKQTEFLERDQWEQKREGTETALKFFGLVKGDGLLRRENNPHLLDLCLEKLALFQEAIRKNGFDPEGDRLILRALYGDRTGIRLSSDLYDSYEDCLYASQNPEKMKSGWPKDQYHFLFCEIMDKEIRRLKKVRKELVCIEAERTQFEVLSRGVPDGAVLDRLLRYEASLDRSFERTLKQLERLQRMRLGQPVPPSIDVDIVSN